MKLTLAILLGTAAVLLVNRLELDSAITTAAIVAETNDRHSLPPEEITYWRRHERNQALCRGQQYVSQCCTDGRPDLTCLNPENIR